MTWSIVAHDKATGTFAVAVTTCAFAVGARCPFRALRRWSGCDAGERQFVARPYGARSAGIEASMPEAAISKALEAGRKSRHPANPRSRCAWPKRSLDGKDLRHLVWG